MLVGGMGFKVPHDANYKVIEPNIGQFKKMKFWELKLKEEIFKLRFYGLELFFKCNYGPCQSYEIKIQHEYPF
jgi:hypothetical protein